MKLKILLQIAFFLLLTGTSHAVDRIQTVQSKIHHALGSFLEKSDYIVIVNKLDTLGEDLGASEVSGYVKRLPGLSVGVDAKGQIVRQDNSGTQYTGPVAIHIMLDRNVKSETLKMIQASIPDIVGGLNEMDELKVSQAMLRQPAPQTPSAVTVNNSSGAPKSEATDLLKLFAIFLMFAGSLAWMFSRFSAAGKPGTTPSNTASIGSRSQDSTQAIATPSISELSKLNPASVGMYLLKSLKTEPQKSKHWFSQLSLDLQKSVFLTLPAWVSASISKSMTDELKSQAEMTPATNEAELYRQIIVLEQNFKSDTDWKKAFLLWFPAQSLRFVPKQYQLQLSQGSRKTLWNLRPDLGDFVRVHDLEGQQLSAPTAVALHQLFDEMAIWPSNLFEASQSEHTDLVDSWASMINQLTEFGPLESQMAQAKEKLSKEQYQALLLKTAHKESPFLWEAARLKTWLRHIEAQDYFWWHSQVQEKPKWDLSKELRPLRLSMFQVAEKNLAHSSWGEAEKKQANLRILRLLRAVHHGEEIVEDLAA